MQIHPAYSGSLNGHFSALKCSVLSLLSQLQRDIPPIPPSAPLPTTFIASQNTHGRGWSEVNSFPNKLTYISSHPIRIFSQSDLRFNVFFPLHLKQQKTFFKT